MSIYTNATLDRLFKGDTGSLDNLRYKLSYRLNAEENRGKIKFSYPQNGSHVPQDIKLSKTQNELLQFQQSNYLKAISESGKAFVLLSVEQVSPYISGLGEPHVTETGLTLHPTYGVPYLTGSSIKGMFHSWLMEAVRNTETDALSEKRLQALFGIEDEEGNEKRQGLLTFHDVIFPQVIIEPDIMTPHHAEYYNEKPLRDNENTNPIKFIRARFGNAGTLAISAEEKVSGIAELETIAEWLSTALSEYGLGAKTAIGYGRFKAHIDQDKKESLLEEQNRKQKELEEAQKRASLSEEDLFIFDTKKTIEKAYNDQETLDTEVKSEAFIDSILDYPDLVQAVAELFRKIDIWKKPSKKMKPKIKKLKEALQKH